MEYYKLSKLLRSNNAGFCIATEVFETFTVLLQIQIFFPAFIIFSPTTTTLRWFQRKWCTQHSSITPQHPPAKCGLGIMLSFIWKCQGPSCNLWTSSLSLWLSELLMKIWRRAGFICWWGLNNNTLLLCFVFRHFFDEMCRNLCRNPEEYVESFWLGVYLLT